MGTLTAGLIARGYSVGGLSSTGQALWKGELSALVCLRLERQQFTVAEPYVRVLDDVVAILSEAGLTWHSLVVSAVGSSVTWRGSNIQPLPVKSEAKPEPEAPKTAFDRIASGASDILPDESGDGS
jgi:hypothetical protein